MHEITGSYPQNYPIPLIYHKWEAAVKYLFLVICTAVKISNTLMKVYCNDTKFSDRHVRASSTYPDQTAPEGSTLFAIQSASFGNITLW